MLLSPPPMHPAGPIQTLALFPPLSAALLELLRSLALADWSLPTVCAGWSVKDVTAHLLGGNFGRLWAHKDASPPAPAPSFDELLTLIDRKNQEWVEAARRISPELLVELLALTDRRLHAHFEALDPEQLARIGVLWAGQDISPNWFDMAREYTEKWLHQQHVRQAVGGPLLSERRWLHPALDTFARGLPYTFRRVEAEQGAAVTLRIRGEAGGEWSLLRQGAEWKLYLGAHPEPLATTTMEQDLAWRLFTRGLDPEAAWSRVEIQGDPALGAKVLELVAIMA